MTEATNISTPTSLYVTGMGLLTPQFPNVDAWTNNSPSDEPVQPTGHILDRRSKRRASRLMKGLADVFAQAAEQANIEPSSVPTVFGSALGEVGTMIGLLDQMWADHDPPSPMAFANSVHNAASGAVSIGTKNRGFTTSIASDFDTIASALCEAQGLLLASDATDVIIVIGDEAAPKKLVQENFNWDFLIGALALTTNADHAGTLAELRNLQIAEPPATTEGAPGNASESKLHTADLEASVARNPQAAIVDLIDAISHRLDTNIRLDRGAGRGWTVQLSPCNS